MAYFTTQLCTKILRPPLAWSPPVPIDIDSPIGTLVGASPFGVATKYGLGTDSLRNVLKRNYEPQELSWRLTGKIIFPLEIIGHQNSPGAYTGTTNFDPTPASMEMEFNNTGNLAALEMPDFSREERTVARMIFEQEFALEGLYPIGRDDEGVLHGGYLVVTMAVSIQFLPYSWSHLGSYYLEQDVGFGPTVSLHSGPGKAFSEYAFDEGVEINFSEGGLASVFHSTPRRVAGSVSVRDSVNGDNWGSVDLWQAVDPFPMLADLQFRNLRHYLPITGF